MLECQVALSNALKYRNPFSMFKVMIAISTMFVWFYILLYPLFESCTVLPLIFLCVIREEIFTAH